MNFEKLNKLTFTTPNPNNDHVCWNKEKPISPSYKFEYDDDDFDVEDYESGLPEDFYRRVISLKTRIDEAVHEAVFEYLNDEELCCSGMFPDNTEMTGNYYIGDERYYLCSNGITVSVQTRFTCMYSNDINPIPYETDYLGLDVGLWINEEDEIEIDSVDSSSI